MSLFAKAQLSENFDDGDLTANPAWSGGTSDFVVNSSLQLQSNNTVANSNYFLSTPNSLATSAQWEMYIQMAFNPSSANYIDIYLTASAGDLTLNTTTGYFVRLGNTNDEICLYRKDNGGTVTKIIDGADDVLNSSNNVMKIKAIRDVNNQWILYRDLSGTGNSYTSEGAATDATYVTSAFFGFLIKQSTSGFSQKHFFDNIEIANYVPDVTPPLIQSATAISSTAVDVLFNEPVETISGQSVTNYSANNGIGNPTTAVPDPINPSLVHLNFSAVLANAVAYTLTVNGVADIAGNAINNGTANFSFYTPQQYDVVIDEIMVDPTPQVRLPNSEWVELRNTSAFAINLQGWKLAGATGPTGGLPNFILQPDSFVVVCTGSAVAGLARYGNTVSVTNFPSLGNDGGLISLYSADGKTIHAAQYSSSWYQNELKKDGGWTLEMIDPKNPCSGIANWKASVDPSGGTPGEKNSVDGINSDEKAPRLLHAYAVNNTTITLVYDEPLDSVKASTIGNYSIDNSVMPANAVGVSPVFDKVNITLSSPIVAGTVYTVAANNITDCKGNAIGQNNTARFGIAEEADSLDVVINEILYNPRPTGVDYVELYNRSQKIIDLSHAYIANRNSSNVISGFQQVSAESILLFPKDFIVLTSDPLAVKNQYITTDPD
ncbi:MAG: lamin tail domain-containing protein, partial [Ginsengibacter sp.]